MCFPGALQRLVEAAQHGAWRRAADLGARPTHLVAMRAEQRGCLVKHSQGVVEAVLRQQREPRGHMAKGYNGRFVGAAAKRFDVVTPAERQGRVVEAGVVGFDFQALGQIPYTVRAVCPCEDDGARLRVVGDGKARDQGFEVDLDFVADHWAVLHFRRSTCAGRHLSRGLPQKAESGYRSEESTANTMAQCHCIIGSRRGHYPPVQ